MFSHGVFVSPSSSAAPAANSIANSLHPRPFSTSYPVGQGRDDVSFKNSLLSGHILSVSDFEKLCHSYRTGNSRQCALPVRLLLECSRRERDWLPISYLGKLIGHNEDIRSDTKIWHPAEALGFIDLRRGQYKNIQSARFIRLNPNINSIPCSSYDGKVMEKIRVILEKYCHVHSKATPIAGLFLAAFFLRKCSTPTDIAEVVYGSRQPGYSTVMTKIAEKMHALGLMRYTYLGGGGPNAKAMISEVGL